MFFAISVSALAEAAFGIFLFVVIAWLLAPETKYIKKRGRKKRYFSEPPSSLDN